MEKKGYVVVYFYDRKAVAPQNNVEIHPLANISCIVEGQTVSEKTVCIAKIGGQNFKCLVLSVDHVSGLDVLYDEVFSKRRLYYEDVGQRWSAELKLNPTMPPTTADPPVHVPKEPVQQAPAPRNTIVGPATVEVPSTYLRSRSRSGKVCGPPKMGAAIKPKDSVINPTSSAGSKPLVEPASVPRALSRAGAPKPGNHPDVFFKPHKPYANWSETSRAPQPKPQPSKILAARATPRFPSIYPRSPTPHTSNSDGESTSTNGGKSAEETDSMTAEESEEESVNPPKPSTSAARKPGRPRKTFFEKAMSAVKLERLVKTLRIMVKQDPKQSIAARTLAEKLAKELYKLDFSRLTTNEISILSHKINRAVKVAFFYSTSACITRRMGKHPNQKNVFIGFCFA